MYINTYLRKTGLKLIKRLTHKCNINDAHFKGK